LISIDMRAVCRTAAAAALVLGASAPAAAQIYTWRDANGTLHLSDVPVPGSPQAEVRTYAVPNSDSGVRATVYVPPERARTYDDLIVAHARQNGVRPDLVRAVVQVESAFNPNARSPKGAQGLMQLMPATARELGVADPYDPEENIRGGVKYLRQLLDRYGNNEELALAAYNAGPGAVDKYGETVPPYRETKDYVSKIGKLVRANEGRVPGTEIYATIEIKPDGRAVPKYSDQKPR
jgi:soluble lytic murein transglycosylase-like protein